MQNEGAVMTHRSFFMTLLYRKRPATLNRTPLFTLVFHVEQM